MSALDNSLDSSKVPFWRTEQSNGRRPRVGKYGEDWGDRGIYDSRNQLNELTGKEWIYFLNSVWITAYPPIADQCGFDLRKIHPSPKPPLLMKDIIAFFSKRNDWILDPFAGVGGTLLGASLSKPKRNVVGIDINPLYVETYKEVCRVQGIKPQTMLIADSNSMLSLPEIKRRKFDLILTDPPYSNIMSRPKNGHKKKLYGRNDPTPYSESKDDIGNLPYHEFLESLREIIEKAVSRLKEKKYLVIFCRDLQPTRENSFLMHADIIKQISSIPGMFYKGMRIWHDRATDLYPFGYPYAFVMNQMHQYILVFRKEEES